MAPETAPEAVTTHTLEIRFTGGIPALNRLLTTFQNKRMPVSGFTLCRDGGGMRATVLVDCPSETADRYIALLSGLEDVERAERTEERLEIALLKVAGDGWEEAADDHGIERHRSGDTVVASGEPEKMEAWLSNIQDDGRDAVRIGPVARPGNGGV